MSEKDVGNYGLEFNMEIRVNYCCRDSVYTFFRKTIYISNDDFTNGYYDFDWNPTYTADFQ